MGVMQGPDRAGEAMSGSGKRARGKRRERHSRGWSLETAAREYVWLWDERHGMSLAEIAAREGVSLSRVLYGLERARAQEKPYRRAARRSPGSGPEPPRLEPLFPVGPYTPTTPCGHNRPIQVGSALCCMVCHASGLDGHPAFVRDPKTDPAPEPKPADEQTARKKPRETRKQKRQRLQEAKAALTIDAHATADLGERGA